MGVCSGLFTIHSPSKAVLQYYKVFVTVCYVYTQSKCIQAARAVSKAGFLRPSDRHVIGTRGWSVFIR